MQAANARLNGVDVLSPRSTNIPTRPRPTMKDSKTKVKMASEERPTNPDRIEDRWRPPPLVVEPGLMPETYVMGRKLGKGGFAVCFEGQTKSTSELVALKVVKSRIEQKKMAEKFRTELQIHAKMCHPNIVEFHRAFSFGDHTYVVLELCENGNLTDMVKARSCLSLPEVRRFMIQICGGVKYMHKRSVIHRDLKMGNIFLDAHMNIKIGDFGLAAVMADEQDRRTTLCGTPNYIAPEILSKSGTRGHDNKVDTWAIGVICYAMLMGTPPFQSKTQQEIYSKLKTLEYEWKIDGKNYVPQQAKEFVASCLTLASAERPGMDELVDHDFFTMGTIAEELESACLKSTPRWLENADPCGDKTRRGYGISHTQMCKTCGVGKMLNGSSRPACGQKSEMSTLVEIEIENRQGCAPSVPLPEGMIYKQFAAAHAEWTSHQKYPLIQSRPRSRKPPSESTLDCASVDGGVEQQVKATVPARAPVQSFAALQRQQARPVRASSRVVEVAKTVAASQEQQPVSTEQEIPASSRGYLRERPLRATSLRSNHTDVTRGAGAKSTGTLPKSETLPSDLESLASGRPTCKDEYITVEPSERRHARTRSKVQLIANEVSKKVKAAGDATTESAGDASKTLPRALRSISANDRQPTVENETRSEARLTNPLSTSLPEPHLLLQPTARVISKSDLYTLLPNSAPVEAISLLRHLEDNLTSTSIKETAEATDGRAVSGLQPHPRVDKWVDYSSRHGVAYILSDHTAGVVLRSSADNSRASSCVVLRDAALHVIRRAQEHESQIAPQGKHVQPVEFYEKAGGVGTRRLSVPSSEFAIDASKCNGDEKVALAKVCAGRDKYAVERAKMVGLCDKFSKYMYNKKSEEELDDEMEQLQKYAEKNWLKGKFVNFYQRIGNVGMWGFNDGGLQANFPDHTKVVVYRNDGDEDSEGGWMVDMVYLQAEDAKYLARYGLATSEMLEKRDVLSFRLHDLLGKALNRSEREIVKSNQLKEKLMWVKAVIRCWIKEGGVGRMGDKRFGWDGLQDRKQGTKSKLIWVSVGKEGGDADAGVDERKRVDG